METKNELTALAKFYLCIQGAIALVATYWSIIWILGLLADSHDLVSVSTLRKWPLGYDAWGTASQGFAWLNITFCAIGIGVLWSLWSSVGGYKTGDSDLIYKSNYRFLIAILVPIFLWLVVLTAGLSIAALSEWTLHKGAVVLVLIAVTSIAGYLIKLLYNKTKALDAPIK